MDPKRIGESISRLLGLHLLTQAELGRELGISPQTMTSIVRGHGEARASTYQAIFAFFGLNHFVEDFETALPEVMANFAATEAKARSIRRRRRSS
jgi:transcriptional regulator with XRE-family HTH domain